MKATLSYDSKGQQCPCVNLIICDLRFHVWCFIHVGNTLFLSYYPLTFPVLTGKEITHFPYRVHIVHKEWFTVTIFTGGGLETYGIEKTDLLHMRWKKTKSIRNNALTISL